MTTPPFLLLLLLKTWRHQMTSKCSDTDNRGSGNREPTVLNVVYVKFANHTGQLAKEMDYM